MIFSLKFFESQGESHLLASNLFETIHLFMVKSVGTTHKLALLDAFKSKLAFQGRRPLSPSELHHLGPASHQCLLQGAPHLRG
jgi:hypothetical protein